MILPFCLFAFLPFCLSAQAPSPPEAVARHFETVAGKSDRVKIVDIGGAMPAAIVSAPDNIRNLEQIRADNQRLADPRALTAEEARRLVVTQKAVLAIRVADAANELVDTLATAGDPEMLHALQNVVVILIPSLDSGGRRLVHRDGFMMNVAENRNVARFLYTEWHPQVFLAMHQTGTKAPIDPNDDPLIRREAGLLRSAMALELERDLEPGYEDPVPLGHNTVYLETADEDLRAVRGLLQAVASYRERIVRSFYDTGSRAVEAGRRGGPFAFMILPGQHDPSAVAKLEDLLLQAGVEIHRAIEPFRADGDPYPPGVDVILLSQPYRAYAKTLLERQKYTTRPPAPAAWTLPLQMGVEVRTIERSFEPPAMSRVSSAVIPPAKVWGERKPGWYIVDAAGNGGAIAGNRLLTADVATAWLTSELEINGYKYAVGSLVAPFSKASQPIVEAIARELGLRVDGVKGKIPAAAHPIGRARVGLYTSGTENGDDAWTRWLLERYEFPFSSLSDADMRAGDLRAGFDAIILSNVDASVLGEHGIEALEAFLESGGTLICLDRADELAIKAFKLPIRNVASGDRFFCPGSIVRVELDPAQPLSYGMAPHTAGFLSFGSAYEVVPSPGAPDVQTIARYGDKEILLSGWLEGDPVIAGRSAVVQARVGTGRVILIGFSAQHAAQSHATFRLLFNSIFTSP